MIVLDTNVISEIFKPKPARAVVDFLRQSPAGRPWLTAITAAELRFGCAILPMGGRRNALIEGVEHLLGRQFVTRILPFDVSATHYYADLMTRARASGRAMQTFDAMIAAIVASRGGTLVTRNVRDFAACGIPLINPWE